MIKRKANIELLRLIAMMMVVTIHYIGRGHILENVQMFSGDYFLFNFWNSVIVMAVNLFVIISGYFLIESRIRVQKLIDIVIEVFIWSLGIYIVLTLTGFVPFSLVGLVKSAFPILTKQYWFVSVFTLAVCCKRVKVVKAKATFSIDVYFDLHDNAVFAVKSYWRKRLFNSMDAYSLRDSCIFKIVL